MTDILMPALSPTMEEGVLAKWHVKVGDTVSAGDVIAEIETDKATMEVEAVDEGEVLDILVAEGTEGVKVNTVIARLAGEDGAKASAPKADALKIETEAPAKTETPKAQAAEPATAKSQADVSPPEASGERVFSSPLARRLAEQAVLDIASIKGTGPHGRIVKRDVEAAGKGGAKAATAPATQGAAPAAEPRKAQSLAQMGIPDGSYDLIPLDGMKKAIGTLNPKLASFDASCFDGIYVTGDITADDIARLNSGRPGAEASEEDSSRLALPNPNNDV